MDYVKSQLQIKSSQSIRKPRLRFKLYTAKITLFLLKRERT